MKFVNRYNNKYSVTKDGKIWSNYSGIFLKTKINRLGYEEVRLHDGRNDNGTHTIHRLVAQAFLPNPNNLSTVNHKNGIKADNRAENLEWCNQKENIRHAWRTGLAKPRYDTAHPCTKLTLEQIKEILPRIDGKYGTLSRIAREYNVSPSLLSLIGRGYRTTT